MRKQLLSLISPLLALALLAGACSSTDNRTGPGPRDEQPVRGGSFVLAATQDALILNPILAEDAASGFINRLIFDSLLRVDDQFQLRPALAESLPVVEEGGRKWTFRLRRDVKFHDGQPLTGKDVRFTFEAVLHPGHAGVRTSNFNSLRGVAALRHNYDTLRGTVGQGKLSREEADRQAVDAWENWRRESGAIQTPDPYTVVFTLDVPSAPTLAYVANVGILPEHKLAAEIGLKMKESLFNRSPVGSGRYAFSEWRPGERLVLKASDSWWGGRPNIDELIWQLFPDSKAAMQALESGSADSAAIDAASVGHFARDVRHVRLIEYPTTIYTYVALDLNSDIFRDVRVRQGLASAVSKEALVERVLDGHGTPAWSHGTPTRWDYNPAVRRFPYDLSKMVALLEEAGWVLGADGTRAKEGKRFAFTLTYNADEKPAAETARFLQTAWRTAGAEVTLRGVDFATLLDLTDPTKPDRKQPQAYLLNWELGSEPDSHSLWACDGSLNDIGYCSLRVDNLLKQGRLELDQAKRRAIYQDLQQVLAEDQPYIWLYFPNALQGISSRVRGPVVGTPAGLYWNFETWWIAQGG